MAANRKVSNSTDYPSGRGAKSHVDDLSDEVDALWDRTPTWLTSVAGTNALTAVADPVITAYARPMKFYLIPPNTNTGAMTINIDTIGVKSLVGKDAAALAAGNVTGGELIEIVYDGVKFVLSNSGATAPVEVPVGTTLVWNGATPPTGFLEENGAAISRTTYAALYAVQGDKFGNGDGSTTFNLDDKRGRFLRGWDNTAGVDPDAASRTDRGDGTTGDNIGTKQAEAFKSHNHAATISRSIYPAGSSSAPAEVTTLNTNRDLSYSALSVSIGNTGGNETRPVNTNVMFIIKY